MSFSSRHKLEMATCIPHENDASPLSLAYDGKIRSGMKPDLLPILKTYVAIETAPTKCTLHFLNVVMISWHQSLILCHYIKKWLQKLMEKYWNTKKRKGKRHIT